MMSKYNDVTLINATLPVKGLIAQDAKTSNSIYTHSPVREEVINEKCIRHNDSSYI